MLVLTIGIIAFLLFFLACITSCLVFCRQEYLRSRGYVPTGLDLANDEPGYLGKQLLRLADWIGRRTGDKGPYVRHKNRPKGGILGRLLTHACTTASRASSAVSGSGARPWFRQPLTTASHTTHPPCYVRRAEPEQAAGC